MSELDRLREEYRTITEDSEDMFIAKDFVDRIVAALEADVERLKVCGNCEHQDIDVDFDWGLPYVRYECDCHFPGEDFPEENDWTQGKDWGAARNYDRCHFTPSRWTEAAP